MGEQQTKIPYEPDAEYWALLDEYFASERYKNLLAEIDAWDEFLDDFPLPDDYPLPKSLADKLVKWLTIDESEIQSLNDELDEAMREDEGGDNHE